MGKIWRYSKGFKRKIDKLNNKYIYSFEKFEKDVVDFLQNEINTKFRKHKLSGFKEDVFSITLGYDLRALYFFINENKNGDIEYLFFDIGDHDDVY